MPNFIGRPAIPEGLWQRAISLAADRSNPLVEQLTAGMEMAGRGMGGLAQQYTQKQHDTRTAAAQREHDERTAAAAEKRDAAEAVRKKELEAYSSYLATVREHAKSGLFKTMNRSTEGMTTDGMMTTHGLASLMGVKPMGENFSIDKPMSKLDQQKAMFDYRMNRLGFGAGSKDPLMTNAVSIVRGMPEMFDADDATITNTVNRVYQSLKAAQGGKYKERPAPEKPAAPEKKGGLFAGFTWGGSKPAAPAPSKGGYDWRSKERGGGK